MTFTMKRESFKQNSDMKHPSMSCWERERERDRDGVEEILPRHDIDTVGFCHKHLISRLALV